MLLLITGMTIFWLVRIVKGKGRPGEMVLPAWSPPRIVGLLPIGVALLLLFNFSRDTDSYWRLSAAFLWLLIGSSMLFGPSYSKLSDAQRLRLSGSLERTWWVFPATLLIFVAGLVVLLLIAPSWSVSAFAAAGPCVFSIEIIWWLLRLRSVSREQTVEAHYDLST